MLRSAAAILVGVAITIVVVFVTNFVAAWSLGIGPGDPPSSRYLTLNLIGGAIAGLAGGATAMRLAPHRPHGHVIALALVILLLSLPTLFSAPAPGQPAWYGAALSIVGPVSVLIGGLLAAGRLEATA